MASVAEVNINEMPRNFIFIVRWSNCNNKKKFRLIGEGRGACNTLVNMYNIYTDLLYFYLASFKLNLSISTKKYSPWKNKQLHVSSLEGYA